MVILVCLFHLLYTTSSECAINPKLSATWRLRASSRTCPLIPNFRHPYTQFHSWKTSRKRPRGVS